jgi:hypothetical protein
MTSIKITAVKSFSVEALVGSPAHQLTGQVRVFFLKADLRPIKIEEISKKKKKRFKTT